MSTKDEAVKQLLVSARALIAQKENWTTFAPARDKQGEVVDFDSPSAVSWCAVGALYKVKRDQSILMVEAGNKLYAEYSKFQWWLSVSAFNDTHLHEDVIAIFDRAIAGC